MNAFTLDDLRRILRACAGEAESIDLDGDIVDIPFDELGYDSLALLELASRVEREYGAAIPASSRACRMARRSPGSRSEPGRGSNVAP